MRLPLLSPRTGFSGVKQVRPSLVRFARRPKSGFALIIVLLTLVLLVVLLVSFFVSVTGERRGAHIDASTLSVRNLADSTLNIVLAQIRDGSSGFADPSNPKSERTAWISQPGLVRNFAASAANGGNPNGQYKAYKLYSSATMVESGNWDPTKDAVPASWGDSPALYTDLNAPVTASDGTLVYPILDPGDVNNPSQVNGFSLDAAPINSSSGTPNKAPMPVQWLYELKDGTVTASSSGSTKVNVPGSDTSPIVARIAFWTDDDSSKININTAAGDEWYTNYSEATARPGSFWDTPRITSQFDQNNLGLYLQGKNEFQRYPGHPATTYLSAVFPSLTPDQIAALIPRVSQTDQGGNIVTSQGGTTRSSSNTPVAVDSDRLYDSVDELAYKQSTSGASARTSTPILNRYQIEQSRFFLTAHSRAPELNIFGGPRVCVWPITTSGQTAFDQTIAFCSTVGGKPYYFTRFDPSSPYNDYQNSSRNQALYTYLQNKTNLPYPNLSTNNTFKNKLGIDRDQVLTEIFDYIRTVNLIDPSKGAKPYADGTGLSSAFGSGTVVPIRINGTFGLGRFPITNKVAIAFWLNKPKNPATPTIKAQMTPYLILEKFCTMQGFPYMYPDFDEVFSHLDSLQVQLGKQQTDPWTPLSGFSSPSATLAVHTWSIYWKNGTKFGIRCFGGNLGLGSEFFYKTSSSPTAPGMQALLTPGLAGSKYPLSGDPINIPDGLTMFSVRTDPAAKPITMTVSQTGLASPVIQSYSFRFPGPKTPPPGQNYTPNMFVPTSTLDFSQRYANSAQYDYNHEVIWEKDKNINNDYGGDDVIDVEMGGPLIQGDYRIATLLASSNAGISDSEFTPHQLYYVAAFYNLKANSLRDDQGGAPGASKADAGLANNISVGLQQYGSLLPQINYQSAYPTFLQNASNYPPNPDFPSTLSQDQSTGGARLKSSYAFNRPGDWDNGIGDAREGAYSGMADEGIQSAPDQGAYYQSNQNSTDLTAATFSPNRQIASAVSFGSLPTGYQRSHPWQTLLFCPNPLAGSVVDLATGDYVANHPGREPGFPADHLLLDLFTMPVVEPYPISEPLSTAGKINLNYQIIPFNYIKRETGLMSLLKSTRIAAIDTDLVATYHKYNSSPNLRYPVKMDETLKDFDSRFAANRPFVTASEICDMYLVPDLAGSSEAGKSTQPTANGGANPVAVWWDNGGMNKKGFYLTGSNLRQRPYADLYPRLTTQSNTYTVHVRVQRIRMPRGVETGSWDEDRGTIESEYRGSYTVERYIDPNDPQLKSGAVNPDTDNLNILYKYRIIDTKKFAP